MLSQRPFSRLSSACRIISYLESWQPQYHNVCRKQKECCRNDGEAIIHFKFVHGNQYPPFKTKFLDCSEVRESHILLVFHLQWQQNLFPLDNKVNLSAVFPEEDL